MRMEQLINEKFDRCDLSAVRWAVFAPGFYESFGLASDEQVIEMTCMNPGTEDAEIARVRAARPGDWLATKERIIVRLGALLDQI